MKVIYLTAQSSLPPVRYAAAIGIFDGLHRGHQYLLGRMLARAKAMNAKSVAVTFFPHPVHVLRPDVKLGYLVSFEHRLKLLESWGLDHCVVVNFSNKFSQIAPEKFITDVLVKRLRVQAVFVGHDFRFGKDRQGDVKLFQRLAPVYGYKLGAVPALTHNGLPISSTRVRGLVIAGDLSGARQLLGRPFSVLGEVVKGKGRGKDLGFPTANVDYKNDILPPVGVYAVRVVWKGQVFKGAANLGLRPTFREKNPKMLLEVHVLDFKQSLYGQAIELQFIKNIRPEQVFVSPPALAAQIQKDISQVRRVL